jgi:hypothetical protein
MKLEYFKIAQFDPYLGDRERFLKDSILSAARKPLEALF